MGGKPVRHRPRWHHPSQHQPGLQDARARVLAQQGRLQSAHHERDLQDAGLREDTDRRVSGAQGADQVRPVGGAQDQAGSHAQEGHRAQRQGAQVYSSRTRSPKTCLYNFFISSGCIRFDQLIESDYDSTDKRNLEQIKSKLQAFDPINIQYTSVFSLSLKLNNIFQTYKRSEFASRAPLERLKE